MKVFSNAARTNEAVLAILLHSNEFIVVVAVSHVSLLLLLLPFAMSRVK